MVALILPVARLNITHLVAIIKALKRKNIENFNLHYKKGCDIFMPSGNKHRKDNV
jgi:hypothetical protein